MLLAILLPISVEADAWVKHRRCNWIYKEWKTLAWTDYVPDGLHINVDWECREKDKSCDLAESDCFWSDKTRTRAYAVGGDEVSYSNGGPFTVTLYNYSNAEFVIVPIPWIPGDGNQFAVNSAGFNSLLVPADQTKYHITRPYEVEATDTQRGKIAMTEKPIYNEGTHTVTLQNVKGILEMGVVDLVNDFSALTLSITHEPETYLPSEDPYGEQQEYMENLIWSSTAMLNNGRILMDGDLKSSYFTITKNDGQKGRVEVQLNIDVLDIQIPKDISLDDISVNIGVDGGNLGYGISRKFSIPNPSDELIINPRYVPEEVFEFENYPNPVSDQLKIKAKLPYTYQVEIRLLDIDGNPVKQLYSGSLLANQLLEINTNLEDLKKKGVYFIEMYTRDRKLIRKIIVK